MPTYRYRCKSCGHEMTAEQRMADDPLVKCPVCRKRSLVRIIGSAGLVFKGSGFYLTDYKKRGSESAASTTSSEESSTSEKSPAKEAGAKGEPAKGDAAKDRPGKGDSGKSEGGKKPEKRGKGDGGPKKKGG